MLICRQTIDLYEIAAYLKVGVKFSSLGACQVAIQVMNLGVNFVFSPNPQVVGKCLCKPRTSEASMKVDTKVDTETSKKEVSCQ